MEDLKRTPDLPLHWMSQHLTTKETTSFFIKFRSIHLFVPGYLLYKEEVSHVTCLGLSLL